MKWRDLINESKDRLIDRLDQLDVDQKQEMKAFFKKRPNMENRLDWNKPKSITWGSFEKIRDGVNEPIDPDTVPEFSDKRNEGSGIVSYEVEDNNRGMLAVRKVVDTHWGKKVNPWCLISREDYGEDADITQVGSAMTFWDQYNAFPKRIAFKNGKLLAFFASAAYDEENDLSIDGYGIVPWLQYPPVSLSSEEIGKLKDEYKEWLDTEEGKEKGATFAQWIEVNYPDLYEGATTPEETWWDRIDQPHSDVKEIKENPSLDDLYEGETTAEEIKENCEMTDDENRAVSLVSEALMAFSNRILEVARKALPDGSEIEIEGEYDGPHRNFVWPEVINTNVHFVAAGPNHKPYYGSFIRIGCDVSDCNRVHVTMFGFDGKTNPELADFETTVDSLTGDKSGVFGLNDSELRGIEDNVRNYVEGAFPMQESRSRRGRMLKENIMKVITDVSFYKLIQALSDGEDYIEDSGDLYGDHFKTVNGMIDYVVEYAFGDLYSGRYKTGITKMANDPRYSDCIDIRSGEDVEPGNDGMEHVEVDISSCSGDKIEMVPFSSELSKYTWTVSIEYSVDEVEGAEDVHESRLRRGRMLKEGKDGYQLCVGQIFKCDATTGEPKTKNLLDSSLFVDSVDELIAELKKMGLVPEEYSREAFYLNLYDFPGWGQIPPYIDCTVNEDDPNNEYLVRCGDVCLYDENEEVYKEIGGSRKNWLGLDVIE